MAKRFKNFRDDNFDEWEDVRREDRQREKQKNKRRKNGRKAKYTEDFQNFKDFSKK